MISIIVPVYNSALYIKQCIESILDQTYTKFELLIIDDGSTDESAKICDAFLYDTRVKVFHRNNSGVSSSRNFGLEKAKGDFITFIDSDDWVEPEYLEYLIEHIQEADIAGCNCLLEENGKTRIRRQYASKVLSQVEALDCYSNYYYSVVWGKLFKKEVLKGIKFDEAIFYSEDTLFYTEAIFQSNSVFIGDRPLYHYFINENGAMKTFKYEKRKTDFDARLRIVDLYKENGINTDGAICRAAFSALNIVLLCKKNSIKPEKHMIRYVKENRLFVLKNQKIKFVDKVKYILRIILLR